MQERPGAGDGDGDLPDRRQDGQRHGQHPGRQAAPVAAPIVFEDVHFDFDRYSLRPEAVRTLDEAVAVLQQNPDVRVEIEGHTCNIGTAEYNLALGERRANSVRDYLVSRGISAEPLPHRQLRRGAAEVRQRARRDAPSEPPRRARRPADAVTRKPEDRRRRNRLPTPSVFRRGIHAIHQHVSRRVLHPPDRRRSRPSGTAASSVMCHPCGSSSAW